MSTAQTISRNAVIMTPSLRFSIWSRSRPEITMVTKGTTMRLTVLMEYAIGVAGKLAESLKVDLSDIEWTIEHRRGVIDRWEIILSSHTPLGELRDRAGRGTGRTVRSGVGVDPEWSERYARAKAVQASRRKDSDPDVVPLDRRATGNASPP